MLPTGCSGSSTEITQRGERFGKTRGKLSSIRQALEGASLAPGSEDSPGLEEPWQASTGAPSPTSATLGTS